MKITGNYEIPEGVTAIPRKEYLSQKGMTRVVIPDSVTEIGDWAFAFCSNLLEVELPAHSITFGKAVFLDCHKLRRIILRGKEGCDRLLAAVAISSDGGYLLDLPAVGTEEWLQKWDARLIAFLNSPDQEGFQKQILCGEEDYGSTDLSAYESRQRMEKVRLLTTRLLENFHLSFDLTEKYRHYLLSHTKGCVTEGVPMEETWTVCLQEHSTDREWYELFVSLGCLTEVNKEAILKDLNEVDETLQGSVLEMKSYFLQQFNTQDFFSNMDI